MSAHKLYTVRLLINSFKMMRSSHLLIKILDPINLVGLLPSLQLAWSLETSLSNSGTISSQPLKAAGTGGKC